MSQKIIYAAIVAIKMQQCIFLK